ncbi:MAG: methyltransferase domain-containing protein, partial [bacterium]|nr:methyltransferase domain-containing protein [bacterium]
VARVNLNHNREHEYVEFLSLYKFNDGWKITNKISADIPPPYEQHLRSIEDWEQRTHRMQPLDKIMDAVGVKSGMVIGEIGAGRGRVTIPLANRVGDKGSVIANDIDKDALDFLSRRCRDRNIHNIETLLGEENDPLFPDNSLDMAILVWVFGAFEQPAEFFKNLKPSLKPGATFVLVQGNNESANAEAKLRGEEVDPNGPTLEERIEQAGIEAGYELVRIERFLERDIIVILRVKDGK